MHNNPELQAILKILNHDATATKPAYCVTTLPESIKTTLNWDYFLHLIIKHRIIIQAYNYFKDSDSTPKEFFTRLSNLCQKIKMQNLSMLVETIKITRELSKHNITYIILKGIPLGQIAYTNYANRQAKDIDILIDPQNLEKAQQIIINLGFQLKYPTYKLEGFKKNYYLINNHEISLFNHNSNVEVELHFNLNYLGLKFFNFIDIPAQYISINNQEIATATNVFHLVYLMQHASIHAFSRLRWLHDIVLFIKNTDVDLKKVFTLSKILNSEHIVLQTLQLIQQIYEFKNPIIDEIILENKDKKIQDLVKITEEFIRNDYELSANNGAFNKMFFKYRIYLTKITTSNQRLNSIFGDLFKIEKTFPYITMPKYMSFGYYIFYPFIVLKYLRK